MERLLFLFSILAMMNNGHTADSESGKGNKEVYVKRASPSLYISNLNRTVLGVYHSTDPYTKGHAKRMAEKLKEEKPRHLLERVQYLIGNICIEWTRLTGLSQEEMHKILNKIYSEIKTDGPDQEGRIREKLLEDHPEFQKIDTEIIRCVIHKWYRTVVKEWKIREREHEADLLYTYNQVRFGEGYIHDRLAEKWKQFHPNLFHSSKTSLLRKVNDLTDPDHGFSQEEMEEAKKRYERVFGVEPKTFNIPRPSRRATIEPGNIRSKMEKADLLYTYNQVRLGEGHVYDRLADKWRKFHPSSNNYSKATLFKKANKLSHAHSLFSSEEIKSAKLRYEEVFGSENAAPQKKVKWTKEQTADLIYLYNKYKKKEMDNTTFDNIWRLLHPELVSVVRAYRKNLMNKKKFNLSPAEEVVAESRLKATLAQYKQSHQNIESTDKGKLPATESSPGQDLHQQSPDWMTHSPPQHDDLHLTQEERDDLEMWMNEGPLHYPLTPRYPHPIYHYGGNSPPTLSRLPGETSHSHSSPSINDSYTTNPYYEHGSSSHSQYNPNTTDLLDKHGSSSHPPDDPHP